MLCTVVTININNQEGLRRTVESVVGQTCRDFEYVIIDGGSTDGSLAVIEAYSEKIDYWVSEPDHGIYHAMNKGVAKAHGDYCIFMNSGDVFYDDRVLERMKRADRSEDIVVGLVAIGDTHDIISPRPVGELTLYHLYSGAIPHQGSFIRTELLRRHPYDETLRISSDWKFFVQTLILNNCTLRYVDFFVARYDLGGISSKHSELMRKEKEGILREFFPPRLLADYQRMKASECLTQQITPSLRKHYGIDRVLYALGKFLLKLRNYYD